MGTYVSAAGRTGTRAQRRRERLSPESSAIPYSQLLLIGQMRTAAPMMNASAIYGHQFAKPFIDSQLKVSIIVNRAVGQCRVYQTGIFALSTG